MIPGRLRGKGTVGCGKEGMVKLVGERGVRAPRLLSPDSPRKLGWSPPRGLGGAGGARGRVGRGRGPPHMRTAATARSKE